MLRKGSKRVTFSPDVYEKPMISFKYNSDAGETPRNERRVGRGIGSRMNSLSPMRFLCRVGTNMVNALRRFSRTRRRASARGTLDVAPSPRRYSVAGDHYRSEAIDDCIEFINSYRKSF